MSKKPHGAGKSSFNQVNADLLFSEIGLKLGITFLDAACGLGAYTLAASEVVGDTGRIFAFDLWTPAIDGLAEEIRTQGLSHIEAAVADICNHIPLPDASVDVALMAMVVHDLARDHSQSGALKEVQRVLKPTGRLGIVEYKKKDGPPGPPINIRLSPEALQSYVHPYGFQALKTLDIGPNSYLTVFILK